MHIKKAILLRTMAKICKRMRQKKTREQFYVVVRINIKGYLKKTITNKSRDNIAGEYRSPFRLAWSNSGYFFN